MGLRPDKMKGLLGIDQLKIGGAPSTELHALVEMSEDRELPLFLPEVPLTAGLEALGFKKGFGAALDPGVVLDTDAQTRFLVQHGRIVLHPKDVHIPSPADRIISPIEHNYKGIGEKGYPKFVSITDPHGVQLGYAKVHFSHFNPASHFDDPFKPKTLTASEIKDSYPFDSVPAHQQGKPVLTSFLDALIRNAWKREQEKINIDMPSNSDLAYQENLRGLGFVPGNPPRRDIKRWTLTQEKMHELFKDLGFVPVPGSLRDYFRPQKYLE